MRIFVLNQAPSRPLLDVVARLSDRGHSVTLLCGKSTVLDCLPGVAHVWLTVYEPCSTLGRLRSWLGFTLQAMWKLVTLPAADIVVVCTNPPLMPWICSVIGSWKGFCTAVRVLDVYPDVLQATTFRRHQILIRLLAWCNRVTYSRCHAICTIGENMARTIATYAPGQPIRVIPEWATPSAATPASPKPPEDRFVVLVSGNIGLTHDISPLVDASRELADTNVEVVVSTADVAGMCRVFHGLGNVRVVERLDAVAYRAAMHTAHAAFVSMKPGAETASVPSRALAYLENSLPIIAVTEPGDLSEIIERRVCGLIVKPGDGGRGVAKAIRTLIASPQLRNTMADAARATAQKDFAADYWREELVCWIEQSRCSMAPGAMHEPDLTTGTHR